FDFVRDSAQEGLVRKLERVKICRKGHKKIKWNFELPSSGQGQKINTAVERRHPSVEQLVRAHPLASKVVENQDSVVGLHLKRSSIEPGGRIVLQIQHFRRKLAACQNARPAAKNPPPIRFGRKGDGARVVHTRVEDGDNLAVHDDGM